MTEEAITTPIQYPLIQYSKSDINQDMPASLHKIIDTVKYKYKWKVKYGGTLFRQWKTHKKL